MAVEFIDDLAIAITGRVLRTASVRDEPYECVDGPQGFIDKLKRANVKADLFTFIQELSDRSPKYAFPLEWDCFAVLPITSYEDWWKNQINDKTRNMVRKAGKRGVDIRVIEFNDEFVRGVMDIYNESPVIQGKPNRHYRKDFDTVKRELSTFFERSDFIGAYHEGELTGFVKLVHGKNLSGLLHIQSKLAHRDKAPTNALIAKAVEICADRKIPFLHYGIWSRRGFGDFKKHHAFVRYEVPRYFVPLSVKGQLMYRLKLHRRLREVLPETWLDNLVAVRNRWTSFRYKPD